MKEVFNMRSHIKNQGVVGGVGLALSSKLAPGLNMISEMIQNKDFYNNQIFNEDDPAYQKGLDFLKYLETKVTPFSLSARPGDEGLFHKKAQRFFGLLGAPREIERDKWQNEIILETRKNSDNKSRTKYDQRRNDWKRNYKEAIFRDDEQKIIEYRKEGLENGYSTPTSIKQLGREAKLNPYYDMFKNLTPEQQVKIMIDLPLEESEQLLPYLHKGYSFMRLIRQKPEKKEDVMKVMEMRK
jgi:hypothetical protein